MLGISGPDVGISVGSGGGIKMGAGVGASVGASVGAADGVVGASVLEVGGSIIVVLIVVVDYLKI